MGRLQTPQTPRFDLRGTAERDCAGGGPYTAVKHAYGETNGSVMD